MDGPGTVRVTLHSKVEATHDMALLNMSGMCRQLLIRVSQVCLLSRPR